MASIDFDLREFLPEAFIDTPFARDLAKVMQSLIAEPVMQSVNTLMRGREASRDTKSITVVATSPEISVKIPDLFERDSLRVMISGNQLLTESGSSGDLLDAQTGFKKGALDFENRTVVLYTDAATTSNPITLHVLYDSKYALDFEALSKLRKDLGMFLDSTGIQSESISRRVAEDLPYFYQVGHSERFVKYLSFVTGVRFALEKLHCRVNQYPAYGTKVSEQEMIAAGFTQWAHDATLPVDLADYNQVADSVWYRTSHVRLEYDDETFFKDTGFHVNLFEKITQLFYQLAPVQLVLETIVARRTREVSFNLRGAVRSTAKLVIDTDTDSITNIVIT